MKALALAMLLVFGGAAETQPPTQKPPSTLEDLERRRNIEEAMASLERLRTTLAEATNARRADCLSAFGNVAFCDCLNKELPIAVGFETYVALVISPKDKIEALTDQERPIAMKTRAARDQCVGEVFGVRQ